MMEKKRRHDMGEGGYCICPKCGERMIHKRGIFHAKMRSAQNAVPKCSVKVLTITNS
jgi:hypothetical protein